LLTVSEDNRQEELRRDDDPVSTAMSRPKKPPLSFFRDVPTALSHQASNGPAHYAARNPSRDRHDHSVLVFLVFRLPHAYCFQV
jgi:hypothetical protein